MSIRQICIASILSVMAATTAAQAFPKTSTSTTVGGHKLWCDLVLEDFRTSKIGEFPEGWATRHESNNNFAREKKIFIIENSKNGHLLHAKYNDHTVTIARRVVGWDLKKYPYLQWRWKAITLPTGGNESSLSTNDSVGSIYVVWKAGWPFQISWLRLAWSTTLPVGAHVSRRFGYDHIHIVESGYKNRGKWMTARVNVRTLYHRYLGEDLKDPVGLALTTDADGTNSKAEALYADFRLCRKAL